MQKFTRPLTREVEVGGKRLALTFSDKGMSFRPVGSRKPPREMSWPALIELMEKHPAAPAEHAAEAPAEHAAGHAAGQAHAGPEGGESGSSGEESGGDEESADGPSVPSLLRRLDRWLAQHRKRFHHALKPGASDDELHHLEAALGRPVPDDLKALLKWHNGQDENFEGCFREQWYLLSAKQIGEVHAQKLSEEKDRWRPEWVPFLDDDRDDCVLLDTGHRPPPVREFWQKSGDHPAAPSLAAWLAEFVRAVERGEYAEDPERGHFVQKSK